MVLEALAAVVGLVELVALDHRAHRAVEDHDALLQQRGQARAAGVFAAGRAAGGVTAVGSGGLVHGQVKARTGWNEFSGNCNIVAAWARACRARRMHGAAVAGRVCARGISYAGRCFSQQSAQAFRAAIST